MNVLDTVTEIMTKTAKGVAKASETAVDYAKLKLKLSEAKDALNSTYLRIGKLVFDAQENDEDNVDAIEKSCDEVREIIALIADYEFRLGELSGKKTCSNCNARIYEDSVFCPRCGEKVD